MGKDNIIQSVFALIKELLQDSLLQKFGEDVLIKFYFSELLGKRSVSCSFRSDSPVSAALPSIGLQNSKSSIIVAPWQKLTYSNATDILLTNSIIWYKNILKWFSTAFTRHCCYISMTADRMSCSATICGFLDLTIL